MENQNKPLLGPLGPLKEFPLVFVVLYYWLQHKLYKYTQKVTQNHVLAPIVDKDFKQKLFLKLF